jgi:uncharacterized protein (TIGR03435 family)
MKLGLAAATVAVLSAAAFAQSGPRFDVASVKPTAEQGPINVGLRITGAQVRIVSLSLKDYVGVAYQVKPSQVIAPEWAAQLRFDISGNIPADASRDDVPQMLQALLAERFQLKAHREMREFPVYALTVGKGGLKITGTPIDPSEPPKAITAAATGSGSGVRLNLGGGSFALAGNRLEVTDLTMAQIAEAMTRFVDRTIIDATSLPERYSFTLDLTPEDYQATLMRTAVNNGVNLPPQALRLLDAGPQNPLGPYLEKPGLSLEPRRAPLDVVVIDSALKTPTEN